MNAAAGRTAAPRALDWDAALHAGLCLLRLSPEIFWAMTPREFAAACGRLDPHRRAIDRAALEALMRRFPDT